MSFVDTMQEIVREDRFAVNLIAAHVMVLGILVVSFFLRRMLHRSSSQILDNVKSDHWLHPLGQEMAGRLRALLFWGTLAAIALCLLSGVGYHFLGRDVRADLRHWWNVWLRQDHAQLLVGAIGVAVNIAVTWVAIRLVGICFPLLRRFAEGRLHFDRKEQTLEPWFRLAQRFVVFTIGLCSIWVIGQLIGMPRFAHHVIGFILRVTATIIVARLLIIAAPIFTHVLTQIGNRQFGSGALKNYWERITRLFPFGEHCFEAAVYVLAASQCVGALRFIDMVAVFGPRIVECIGIFFATRVLIELLQVLLSEAFGMFKEDEEIDPKGRTLVPLLHSLCQYVLYFGSGILMLGVLGVDTTPVLAGAGILGLGVGLGAQSLVTDVVSGFFILFEGQYLVGDYVQIGDAAGTIEAVGIRVTQIRDGHGKLHIIPNGQIKGVVNYSKGYINAVVEIKVPRGSDLETVIRSMSEAGKRLRQQHREVLADTEVHGIVDLGPAEMTVRAVTKVKPGTHGKMQSEYRRMLKEVFDRDMDKPPLTKAA